MALIVQNCLGACSLSLRKSPKKLSLVQPYNNARNLSNLDIRSSPAMSTFSPLSFGAERSLNVAPKSKENRWRARSSYHPWSSWSETDFETPIKEFFFAINTMNIQLLEERLSSDCVLKASVFGVKYGILGIDPLDEEQGLLMEEMNAESLGEVKAAEPCIRFQVDEVKMCGIDNGIAKVKVDWHVEWNNRPILFTKGCCASVFEFQKENGIPLIRKIEGIVVRDDKLRAFILELLTALTTFYETHPSAEDVLSDPYLTGLLAMLEDKPKHFAD